MASSYGRKILDMEPELEQNIEALLCTPRGYAYIKTAVAAAFLGVSLAHMWNKRGKALLDAQAKEMESLRARAAAGGEVV